jgi:hypothetical protein
MEFNDENKRTILELLKAGNRNTALQFISATYKVSASDAEKLLVAFEIQFKEAILSSPATSVVTGVTGCFSGILKFISIISAMVGLGIAGFGYFAPDLIDDAKEKLMIRVTVANKIFHGPDSLNERLIYQYQDAGEVKYDTGNTIYSAGMYQVGDTLHVNGNEVDAPNDLKNSEGVADVKLGLYLVGGFVFLFGLIFWFVGNKVAAFGRR